MSDRVERPGLYLMVFILLVQSCSTRYVVDRIENKCAALAQEGNR